MKHGTKNAKIITRWNQKGSKTGQKWTENIHLCRLHSFKHVEHLVLIRPRYFTNALKVPHYSKKHVSRPSVLYYHVLLKVGQRRKKSLRIRLLLPGHGQFYPRRNSARFGRPPKQLRNIENVARPRSYHSNASRCQMFLRRMRRI